MSHYVGLDVSKESIFLCILDENGKIVKEDDIPNDPQVLDYYLKGTGVEIKLIGLESGSYTHWITESLQEKSYSVTVMEAGKMAAILASSNINKNDKNDARGIAKALRGGYYTTCVHRSMEAMGLRTALHARDTLIKSRITISNSIKGLLKPLW